MLIFEFQERFPADLTCYEYLAFIKGSVYLALKNVDIPIIVKKSMSLTSNSLNAQDLNSLRRVPFSIY